MNEPANFVQGDIEGCASNKWNQPPYLPRMLLFLGFHIIEKRIFTIQFTLFYSNSWRFIGSLNALPRFRWLHWKTLRYSFHVWMVSVRAHAQVKQLSFSALSFPYSCINCVFSNSNKQRNPARYWKTCPCSLQINFSWFRSLGSPLARRQLVEME